MCIRHQGMHLFASFDAGRNLGDAKVAAEVLPRSQTRLGAAPEGAEVLRNGEPVELLAFVLVPRALSAPPARQRQPPELRCKECGGVALERHVVGHSVAGG